MKTTHIAFLVALAAGSLGSLSSTSAAENEAVQKDLALLQGEWSMVSGSADGQPMPSEMLKQMKRTCKGDEATTTMGGQVFLKARITIDPSRKPKTIDYQMTDGFTKGRRQLGIYEVEGDTFKACFGKPDAERPTDFTSLPGDGRTLSVWKRDQASLDPKLEPLRPLLEKTWRGTFKNSKPDKPTVDVMRWERALNGKAVRVLHSVNDGSYGGETIFRWDEAKQAVTYHYFTTAGFMTVGSMTFKDGQLITHEVVAGGAGGVSEVRGTTELLPGGAIRVKTEHLKNGEWQPGREVTYNEDPGAKVVFK